MPLFTPYFSLDSSAFRVGNGGRLRCRMGASGIGIYVMLLSHLRDCRDCRAPLDYDMLAFDLHEDAAAVRRVVEEFGLFDIDRSSGTFTSSVLTTVRGMLSDDGAAAGSGTTRTVRQRRVRSSGETYRRAVRRLAEDNALPPAEEEAPAEELPTSSEKEITPAEGEPHPAELDAPLAEEENATGDFAPTSIAAEVEPAEVKHESADAEGTPAEVEDQPAEEANTTGDFADAHSPRTEEKRKEQNKKPHTPIVPFPQSGKGTRASHPAAAVVGEREEGATSAEGDEESVVGSPRFVSSAAADADAPPCAASPTVLGAPAQTLDPHPSPDTAKADTSAENGKTSAEKTKTSVPNSQPNTLTTSEAPAHPQTDAAKADTSVPNAQADTEKADTSLSNSQSNPWTTSEEADKAGRDEEGAVEPFVPPTANEVRRFAEALCHPEFDAEWFVAYYTERHWRRHNGRPVVSWQTTARYWLDHPLRVARHLLGHRPAASPVSVGVGTASAVVVPPAGTTAAKPVGTSTHPAAGPTSSTSTGTHPVGTGGLSPRSSASPVGTGAPHVGSLSLPAPTPLQQSRLSDLKGMVLHLFADAPAAAPASASTSPDLSSDAADVSASVPTPATAASPSVRPARILSPAEAAQVIAQQTLAVAESEAVPHVVHDSTANAEEIIDTQASPTNAAEEEIDAQAFSTPDAANDIETQALSPADAEASVRACDNSTDEDGEEIGTQAFSIPDTANNIETQDLSPADTEESVRACDDSTTDAEEDIETQALSPAHAEASVRACDNSTTDAEEDALNGHDSTTDAEEGIETQALSPAHAEESVRACNDSTNDAAKDIDAMPFSTTDTEEDALYGHDSTTDTTKGIETQAFSIPDAAGSFVALPFSAAKGRWGVRSPRGPDPPPDDGRDSTDHPLQSNAIRHAGNDTGNDFADAENKFTAKPSNFSADRHPPAAVGTALAADSPIFPADECRPLRTLTEKHPYLNPSFHEPHPLLCLHPPSLGGFGRTFRVQSVQPPFGRPFLGRFVDIRPACTVGSRPLRPRLTRCRTARGRCRPEHPEHEHHRSANAVERSANAIRPPVNGHEHDARRAKNADFIDVDPARGHKIDRNEPEHADRGRKRHDPAPEHPADAPEHPANAIRPAANEPEHGAQCAKIADFIDVNPACGHKTERNAAEHPTNAVSPLADAGEHADCGLKRHDLAPEHTADGCKRHDPAPEHPAYDLDAGQRVLRSAAHRRAVRAEREACCGALRHLAHCCVAF